MRVGPVRSAMSGASQPRGPTLLLPAARGAPAKRLLDADDAAAVAAKCPRLSECSSPPDYLSPPGSPCSPQPPPAAPGSGDGSGSSPGPSRIADYLLLPLTEREHVSRALCIHTGRELRCKVGSGGWRVGVGGGAGLGGGQWCSGSRLPAPGGSKLPPTLELGVRQISDLSQVRERLTRFTVWGSRGFRWTDTMGPRWSRGSAVFNLLYFSSISLAPCAAHGVPYKLWN